MMTNVIMLVFALLATSAMGFRMFSFKIVSLQARVAEREHVTSATFMSDTPKELNTTTPDLTALVKGIFDDKSANRTLEQLKEVELFKLRDFEGLTKGEFEESLLGVKPPKRRSALRVALLAVLPPLTDSGEYGYREKKRIHVVFSSEDPSRPSDQTERTFTVERDSLVLFWIGQGIMHLVRADGETIVTFGQLEDDVRYRAVRKSDAPERRFAVLDQQLEMDAARRLHKHVLEQHPGAHIHHNVLVYDSGQELAQFDAVVHVDGAGGSFVFVMEAKSRVHPKDPLAVLGKVDMFKRCLTLTDLTFTEGFDPEPNILQFSTHFARDSEMMIPYLAGMHFTPELVESCQRKGVNAIYHSGDAFDLALA